MAMQVHLKNEFVKDEKYRTVNFLNIRTPKNFVVINLKN